MKKFRLFLFMAAFVPMTAMADDNEIATLPMPVGEVPVMSLEEAQAASGVRGRIDCAAIKTEMDELNAKKDDLDEEQAARLAAVQKEFRSNCVKRTTGRVSGVRNAMAALPKSPTVAPAEKKPAPSVTAEQPKAPLSYDDALKAGDKTAELVASTEKDEDCARLRYAVLVAASDAQDAAQAAYDEKCAVPEMTAEEKAEIMVANLEKGLCADGTKPNKFGCCGDEKFKDLGNLIFACCPAEGDCYPPIK